MRTSVPLISAPAIFGDTISTTTAFGCIRASTPRSYNGGSSSSGDVWRGGSSSSQRLILHSLALTSLCICRCSRFLFHLVFIFLFLHFLSLFFSTVASGVSGHEHVTKEFGTMAVYGLLHLRATKSTLQNSVRMHARCKCEPFSFHVYSLFLGTFSFDHFSFQVIQIVRMSSKRRLNKLTGLGGGGRNCKVDGTPYINNLEQNPESAFSIHRPRSV